MVTYPVREDKLLVDRSYLPFESAKGYQDRKMAKWAGFFLSEHRSSLVAKQEKKTIKSVYSFSDKSLFLTQVYSQQQKVRLTIFEANAIRHYYGKVSHLGLTDIQFKSQNNYYVFLIEDIIDIDLGE